MNVSLNVFKPFPNHRVAFHKDDWAIVTKNMGNMINWIAQIPTNKCSPSYFNTSVAKALYSALALDLEAVCCSLELNVIKFHSKKKQRPVVDFLESGSPAKSTS